MQSRKFREHLTIRNKRANPLSMRPRDEGECLAANVMSQWRTLLGPSQALWPYVPRRIKLDSIARPPVNSAFSGVQRSRAMSLEMRCNVMYTDFIAGFHRD